MTARFSQPEDAPQRLDARSGHAVAYLPSEDLAARPRVTFISRKWPPAMGGMETYSLRLSEELEAWVQLKRIVLPGHADGSVPRPRELAWFGLKAAASLLFGRAPTPVVHIADMAAWPLGVVARIRRPGCQIVLSAHGTDVAYGMRSTQAGRLYGRYLRLGARLLPGVTVISNSAATAAAAAKFGYPRGPVVPLAADVKATPRCAPRRSVLFAGRLIPRKGCAWFIREVLPLLPEDISLDVAGTLWDPSEAAALSSPRVRFLGRLDQGALNQAYADALCLVVPNIELDNGEFEGFGLVGIEAAAAGGVVLGARHGGITEAIMDGKTGYLLPPGAAKAWADKISEIADWSEIQRAAFVAESQATFQAHFSWEAVAQRTARHYRAPMVA